MKKLKILLASIYNNDMQGPLEEIGIGIIAAVLRENGYEVRLLASHEDRLDYDGIMRFSPDMVGFTVYLVSKGSVGRVARQLKKILPNGIMCLGGRYATLDSKRLLEENPCIDFVVRGEGEITFLELVDKINNGEDYSHVRGISYRSGGSIIENEAREATADLDTVPLAARDILEDNHLKTAAISTSRGCKARCSFCSTQLYSNKWRGRSIRHVVDELEYLMKRYNINIFHFIDSSMEDSHNNLERLAGIATEIIKRGLQLFYYGNMRAEIHRELTPDIMALLKKSGLNAICVGAEASNNYDLRLYGKIANPEDNHRVLDLFRKHDIAINLGFINFNPYTTLERLGRNLDFLYRWGFCKKFITSLWVYKDTRIYNKLLSENLLNLKGKKGPRYGEIEFLYQDERVRLLAEYLFSYADDLDIKHNNLFINLEYYSFLLWCELIRYRRVLEDKGGGAVLEKIHGFTSEHRRLWQEFNGAFFKWISSLLTIAATGWDEKKVRECTYELMPVSHFVKINREFNNLARKVRLQMARSGHADMLVSVLPF